MNHLYPSWFALICLNALVLITNQSTIVLIILSVVSWILGYITADKIWFDKTNKGVKE